MPSRSWIHISVKPQGSVAGPRAMGTAAAASRACSAWTSRTGSRSSPSAGRAGRVPGDLGQARAGEEHHPGIIRRAELPVDGQAQASATGSRGCSRGVSVHHCAKCSSVEQNTSTSSLPSQSKSREMFYGHPLPFPQDSLRSGGAARCTPIAFPAVPGSPQTCRLSSASATGMPRVTRDSHEVPRCPALALLAVLALRLPYPTW
jgi:hypothetical protein